LEQIPDARVNYFETQKRQNTFKHSQQPPSKHRKTTMSTSKSPTRSIIDNTRKSSTYRKNPKAPKRFRSPFILFSKAKLGEMKERNGPNMPVSCTFDYKMSKIVSLLTLNSFCIFMTNAKDH